MSQNKEDEEFIREALRLGERGLGTTSPNPAVGAVVVRDSEIVGRGWHAVAGGPHAEVAAIADARANQGEDVTRGATIYVTLEPCSTVGRTPACTDAILEAGFAKVVVGATDPNPNHEGAGYEILRAAGIEVVTGVAEEEAKSLLRFFSKHVTTGLPWVIAKTAITLDGRTTLPPELGQWISSEESRLDVQRWRRVCDAVLVGGETFRVDNPSLTLRGEFAEGREQPRRIVLTSDGALPRDHHLFTDKHKDRTTIHEGLSLRDSLQKLGDENVLSVLLESGGRLLAHALEEGLVDELVLYQAPMIGGGGKAVIPIGNYVTRLEAVEYKQIGPDLRIVGRPANSS